MSSVLGQYVHAFLPPTLKEHHQTKNSGGNFNGSNFNILNY
jgi:hypothetical protein